MIQGGQYLFFVGPVYMISQKIKRNSPVHGPAVDVYIPQRFGQLFGQGTFTATAPAVNGYNDLFAHPCKNALKFNQIKMKFWVK
jgi:hypothetical protein